VCVRIFWNVSFAHPTEVCPTVQTLHVIAAVCLLDWRHTTGTAVEIISPAGRPLLEVQILTISARVPLLVTLETHFVRTVCTHRPVFATTGLLNCRIALGCGTPLKLFVLCYWNIKHTLSKDHYSFLRHLQIEEVVELVSPFTWLTLHAGYWWCLVVVNCYFEVVSHAIQTERVSACQFMEVFCEVIFVANFALNALLLRTIHLLRLLEYWNLCRPWNVRKNMTLIPFISCKSTKYFNRIIWRITS
jgi:hypothetical protein